MTYTVVWTAASRLANRIKHVMEHKRSASVYLRSHDFLVEAVSITTAGVGIRWGSVHVLPRSAAVSELGDAVLDALQASTQGVPHPDDWKAVLRPFLEAARARSWHAVQRRAKLCCVQSDETGIRITPTRNGGTRGPERGYHALTQDAIVLPSASTADEIGRAVLSAEKSCT